MTKRQYVIARNKINRKISVLEAMIENSYAVVEGREIREQAEKEISELRAQKDLLWEQFKQSQK